MAGYICIDVNLREALLEGATRSQHHRVADSGDVFALRHRAGLLILRGSLFIVVLSRRLWRSVVRLRRGIVAALVLLLKLLQLLLQLGLIAGINNAVDYAGYRGND